MKGGHIIMKNLIVEFQRFGNTVVSRMVEFPEELRGNDTLINVGGFRIISNRLPQITSKDTLYISGTEKKLDTNYFSFIFSDEDEAKKFIVRANEAIFALNKKNKEEALKPKVDAEDLAMKVAKMVMDSLKQQGITVGD